LNKSRLSARQSGVSLLELLLVIVIMAIITIPLFSLFNQALVNYTTARVMITMNYIAQFTMETMLSADFFSLNQYALTNQPAGTSDWLSRFSYTVNVDPINPALSNDLASSAVVVSRETGTQTLPANAVTSDYMRIHVRVTNTLLPNKEVNLRTIVTASGQGY
jgi:prepilin-type N-terminal cleavage/methylation domain-containing protein